MREGITKLLEMINNHYIGCSAGFTYIYMSELINCTLKTCTTYFMSVTVQQSCLENIMAFPKDPWSRSKQIDPELLS